MTPYYETPEGLIYKGDALDVLRTMPEASVHCVVTSPPYWGLRDYGIEGQLGLEKTPEEYIEKMVEIFREVRRLLRGDGSCWLNLGDSMSVGSNFINEINSIEKFGPFVFGNAATIGITSKGGNIPLNDKPFPYNKFISLLGIERIVIKQRDHNFSQVLNTLNTPSYCWIGAPALRISRNVADLEIIMDSGYDIRIVISEHDSEGKAILPIFSPFSTINRDGSFSIEKSAKPISEIVRNGESIGDSISFDACGECLPDIYFINKPVALGDAFNSTPSSFGNFRITKASPQEISFESLCSPINLTAINISHFYLLNSFGSFVHYNELYDKAIRMSRA